MNERPSIESSNQFMCTGQAGSRNARLEGEASSAEERGELELSKQRFELQQEREKANQERQTAQLAQKLAEKDGENEQMMIKLEKSEALHKESGRVYYYHKTTMQTSWTMPTAA